MVFYYWWKGTTDKLQKQQKTIMAKKQEQYIELVTRCHCVKLITSSSLLIIIPRIFSLTQKKVSVLAGGFWVKIAPLSSHRYSALPHALACRQPWHSKLSHRELHGRLDLLPERQF
jgi:hypothetical protein